MTTQKKPEDMPLAEIKEQMALYCRLYYHKRKEEDPEYMDTVRARKRITGKALYHKKKAEREAMEKKEKEKKMKINQSITIAENTKLNMRWLLSLISSFLD